MEFTNFIHEIDDTNHHEFLKKDFSILHFFSEWKMDCLRVLPIIEGIAEEFNGKIHFGKVNIDEFEGIAETHNITRVPSILFFKKGLKIDKLDRLDSEDVLREKIHCLL